LLSFIDCFLLGLLLGLFVFSMLNFYYSVIQFSKKYMTTTSHKGIGILYLYSGWLGGFFGFFLSLWIRLEMNYQGLAIVRKVKELNFYNHVISAHGLVMLFAFIMPVAIGGYGNLLLPVLIGSSELTMPRLNGVSYWLYMMGALTLVIAAFFFDKPICAGWTVFIMVVEEQSLNSTRCGNLLFLSKPTMCLNIISDCYIVTDCSCNVVEMVTFVKTVYLCNVIIAVRKSACVYLRLGPVSNRMYSHQRLNVELSFVQWFVGVTDGAGCFSFSKQNCSFCFTYKLTQSKSNARLLYYIKAKIGYGSITEDGPYLLQYRIRDQKVLMEVIIPMFETYKLHTSKYYSYTLFKQALDTPKGDTTERMRIKGLFANNPTPSPHNQFVPTKSWIVGFIEAEGSFYIVKKDSDGRYVHGFGVTQKLDKHILFQLKSIFGIVAQIKATGPNKDAWLLETTNSRCIEFLINYFKDQMKGMKAVEYRIWARSYIKHKGDYVQLAKIQKEMQDLRKIYRS
jgi:hypothetical protein